MNTRKNCRKLGGLRHAGVEDGKWLRNYGDHDAGRIKRRTAPTTIVTMSEFMSELYYDRLYLSFRSGVLKSVFVTLLLFNVLSAAATQTFGKSSV